MKENRKKKAVIAGAAVVVICIAVFALLSGGNSSAKRIAELLDLGNKYLTEQDYEEAVVAFQEAIAIDPKCEEAYLGLADVYVATDDYESAIDILQQGMEQVESPELADYLEKVQESSAKKNKEISQESVTKENYSESEEEEAENPIPVEDIEYLDDGSYRVYEYDANGNLIRMTRYLVDGDTIVHDFEYDIDGNWLATTSKSYWHDGSVYGLNSLWEYDENMNVIQITTYDGDGSISHVRAYEYQYNSSGGTLMKETEYKGDGTIEEKESLECSMLKKVKYPDGRVRFEYVD